jgi:di/tricarboxylate transporter
VSWEGWFTLAVVVVTVVAVAREITAPSVLIFGAAVVLLVARVLEPSEAFSGFSNPAPITVAALYVIAAAVERTGLLAPVLDRVLGKPMGERSALARMALPSAATSAFLNNTPIVATLVPAVSRWADRNRRSVSAFLMPLSYAAILGGMVTVIGTSTNVVVSGLLEAEGMEPLGFFEIGKAGLPIAVAGLAVLLLIAPVVLPRRRSARSDLEADIREFVVDMTVVPSGSLDGTTVRDGGLRHLSGVFLVQIDRDGEVIAPVSPSVELHGGDRLRFVGKADDVADLHNTKGLAAEAGDMEGFDTTRLVFFEAVVGSASPLVGRSLRDVGFRARYQAAVVAIHRAGQRVEGKLGEVRLRVGDTLLLLAGSSFLPRWRDRSDFLVVSRLSGVEPFRSERAVFAGLITLGVVVAAAAGLVGILEASLVGALAIFLSGTLTAGEARNAIDLNVLVVIGSAFGIGSAVAKTGLADKIADIIVGGFAPLGERGVLLGVVLATILLTELITNNAAAILMFPIAVATAAELDAEPRAFVMAVALAASASFLTPIGYQTNTMVWGPGGYRFSDYARLGCPLTAIAVGGLVALTPVFWPL